MNHTEASIAVGDGDGEVCDVTDVLAVIEALVAVDRHVRLDRQF